MSEVREVQDRRNERNTLEVKKHGQGISDSL